MRSDPVDPRTPAGTRRVLMVGNSVLFGGAQTDQSEVCSTLLGQRLPADLGQPVQVLNLSAGGWAVANELGYLKSRGILDSEQVYLLLNTRDLKRAFCGGSLTDPNYPQSNPLSAVGELCSRYLLPRLTARAGEQDKGSAQLAPGEYLDPAIVLNQLTELHAAITKDGGALCVIYSPVNPHGGYWTPDDHLLLEGLTTWAQKEGVPFFDLTDAYAKEPTDHIYRDAIHINAGGQAAAAKALEPWMAGLLKAHAH